MSFMSSLSKKWIWLSILVAFMFVGFRSADVFADTSASDEGDAIITVHVLSAETEEPTPQEDPTSDPDPSEYVDPEIKDDTPPEVDVEPGNDEDSEGVDDNGETIDEIYGEDSEGDEFDDIIVPNTGGNTNTDVFGGEGESSGIWIIGLIATITILATSIIVWVVKKKKTIRSFDQGISRSGWKGVHMWKGMLSWQSRHSSIGFSGEKNRWSRLFTWRKVTAVMVPCGVLLLVGMLIPKSEQPEEVVAAGFTYPYTVSTDDGKHYDIYVKQGEFKRGAFAIKTSTNNLTGYTLNMATAAQNLTDANNNTAQIAMVADGTTAENFADNTWGFSTDGSSYGKLPNGRKNGKRVHQTKGASANGNSITVYFAAKIAEDMPVGDYTTTVYLDATTNPVYKNLTFANGNVAKITRVSDNSTITTNSKVLLGEELKINNTADGADIVQTATVNDAAMSNGTVMTVDKDIKIGTKDDSIHFLKNDYGTGDDKNASYGDAILIRSQGKYWMVDTGRADNATVKPNGSTVVNYLKKLGIKSLDYVLYTHVHGDHMGSVYNLINQGFINSNTTVYMRGCAATETIGDDGKTASSVIKDSCNNKINALKNTAKANVIDFYNHETERANIQANGIDFGNFKMTLFNIDKGSDGHIDHNKYRENLNSIGMKVTHKPSNKTAFLAADWEWGIESKYSSKIGKVDILKAGHHGIKTSNSYGFIKTLNPKTVIVTSQNVANASSGIPNRQPAAWAYVEQNNGSVYFTGDSTGDAVALSFGSSNYSVKKGKAHSTLADANTSSNKRKTGGNYMQWSGGLTGWGYPANKDGSGKDSDYNTFTAKFYVYVYQKKSSYGNIIAHVDKCINKYTYTFSSSYGDGVSKGRTSGCK